MKQRTRVILGVLVVAALVGAVVYVRLVSATPSRVLTLAGDVRPDIRTITAPSVSYPTPDYTVGIPTSATTSPSSSAKRRAPAASTGQPMVAGMLTHVYVGAGDTVKPGQVVATFDTRLLKLGVDQAKTASVKAHKEVSVMGHNIDTVITAQGKIATARGKIATARAALIKGRAALLKAKKTILAQQKQLLALKAKRPQLKALLAQLKAQAATFPPGHVPPALLKQIATITGTLAAIDPGLAAIAKGLVIINTNLAKIATGFAALPKAIAQLNTAAKQLSDAKSTLRNAKTVLKIVAKGSTIGIKLANASLELSKVRAPYGGVVTFARESGTVAMVGAPLVSVQYDGPRLVDTYLTPDQIPLISIGSPADITYDSGKGLVLHGKVSVIGSTYEYPPTSFPTNVVHMTRTTKVTITLDSGSRVPPGTPVDVSIHENSNG